MSDVSMVYDNGTRAVKRATLRIDEGEFAFLVGPSGSGKSTLIKLLTGEVRPTSGRIVVNNYNIGTLKKREVPYLRRTLGVVFQDFRLIEKKSAYDNVAFAMRAIGARNRAIRKRVPYVLELVGLADKMDVRPMEMSGGEQQRVAIARALVNNPRLIIADEPTGNLDPARSYELMALFEKINRLGTTVLIVTHEKELVDEFEKRVIMIDDGYIVSDQTGGYYAEDEFDEEYEEGGFEEEAPRFGTPLSMLFDRFAFKSSATVQDEIVPEDLEGDYIEEEELFSDEEFLEVEPYDEEEAQAQEDLAPLAPSEQVLETGEPDDAALEQLVSRFQHRISVDDLGEYESEQTSEDSVNEETSEEDREAAQESDRV